MNDDIQDLYQEVILDHGRHPRNFGKLEVANRIQQGLNPLCGDEIQLYLLVEGDQIKAVRFCGEGCAISQASASIMTTMIEKKSLAEVEKIFHAFHQQMTDEGVFDEEQLGKLKVLSGVKAYPARVKCATLAWHTLQAALKQSPQCVST